MEKAFRISELSSDYFSNKWELLGIVFSVQWFSQVRRTRGIHIYTSVGEEGCGDGQEASSFSEIYRYFKNYLCYILWGAGTGSML